MTVPIHDYLVIGGGMAGVSAGYHLAQAGQVRLLEQESDLAYHTTGRSAAMYIQTYGNAAIRALTAGCLEFYTRPPAGFSDVPLLTPRGTLQVASEVRLERLEAVYAEVRGAASVQRLDGAAARELVPVLRPEAVAGALYEAGAMDMDVDAIHQGFLRGMRARGAEVSRGAGLRSLERARGIWHAQTDAGGAAGRVLVNAAGAWGDEVAALAGARPVGLVPKRRTAILFAPPPDVAIEPWPLTLDIDERVYFKPEAGNLMGSPADETPSPPCDAQPEEIDVAVAVDRIEALTTLAIPRILHRWAGLRTFAPDRTPVVGYDPDVEGFFWLVGQGGYGIQTAPALGRVAAALAAGSELPSDLVVLGVSAEELDPGRLRSALHRGSDAG